MTQPDRDYLSDMAKLITDNIPEGVDFKAVDIATNIYSKIEATDPELLEGWLRVQAVSILSTQITARRSYLARTAIRQEPSKFQQAAEAFENGDTEPLSVFLQTVAVNSDNIVRPLGNITKTDALWISESHAKRAKAAAFESEFYAAVAKKIPDGQTLSDVMSETEFLLLRESLHQL